MCGIGGIVHRHRDQPVDPQILVNMAAIQFHRGPDGFGYEVLNDAGVGFCSLMATVNGKLIIVSAKGELIIAKANPAKFEPISRTPVLKGRCWSAPVLANGLIYVRNAAGDVACLSVK